GVRLAAVTDVGQGVAGRRPGGGVEPAGHQPGAAVAHRRLDRWPYPLGDVVRRRPRPRVGRAGAAGVRSGQRILLHRDASGAGSTAAGLLCRFGGPGAALPGQVADPPYPARQGLRAGMTGIGMTGIGGQGSLESGAVELRPWRPDDADALLDAVAQSPDLDTQLPVAELTSRQRAEQVIADALGCGEHWRNWAVVVAGAAVGN